MFGMINALAPAVHLDDCSQPGMQSNQCDFDWVVSITIIIILFPFFVCFSISDKCVSTEGDIDRLTYSRAPGHLKISTCQHIRVIDSTRLPASTGNNRSMDYEAIINPIEQHILGR